jgi:acyl carrier protein
MALTEQDVLAGLAELVNDETGIAADAVQMDKSFTDDLDKIPDEEVKNLVTVADAVKYITANQG